MQRDDTPASAEERHYQAMDKIGQLVAVRDRTCSELVARLKKSGFTSEEADEAVSSAVCCGLVDEERYARSFIRGKSQMGWGRVKIEQRLMQAGIDSTTLMLCDDEFPDSDDEYEMALRELSKRPCTSKDPYASLMRRLVGKGYSYDTAKRAVREHLSDSG